MPACVYIFAVYSQAAEFCVCVRLIHLGGGFVSRQAGGLAL